MKADGSRRALAWGGVIGPTIFVVDWAVLGATRSGYSPVGDAISRLAEMGASTRPEMTAGFVVYGAGVICYGAALRQSVLGPAWLSAIGTGVATLGVAAFPLGTPTSGAIHAAFAVLGYIGLAALPMTTRSQGVPRSLAVLTTGAIAASLLASVTSGSTHGLTQRIGLTIGDAWMIVSALRLLRRHDRAPLTIRVAAPGRRRPPGSAR